VKANRSRWITVADLCGRWRLRYVLEDVIFAFLEPKEYSLITSVIKKRGKEHLHLLEDAIAIVRYQCEIHGHKDIEIYARRKNVYGVYVKMRGDKKTISQVRDIFGVRVLVKTTAECYEVLHIIQNLWPSYPEHFKDLIHHPKPNGYQSLHLTVSCLQQQDIEFQIRTFKMHEIAQFGIANHASYKSATRWLH
jgi:GTP diphosphokinase / guanosine-3',5'-bis(diphosphate) 3'-diphosphatase